MFLGLLADQLDALIARLHLFQACLVHLGGPVDIQSLSQLRDLFHVLFFLLKKALLDHVIALLLVQPLGLYVYLEGLLMRLLPHHALQLKRVCLSTAQHIESII